MFYLLNFLLMFCIAYGDNLKNNKIRQSLNYDKRFYYSVASIVSSFFSLLISLNTIPSFPIEATLSLTVLGYMTFISLYSDIIYKTINRWMLRYAYIFTGICTVAYFNRRPEFDTKGSLVILTMLYFVLLMFLLFVNSIGPSDVRIFMAIMPITYFLIGNRFLPFLLVGIAASIMYQKIERIRLDAKKLELPVSQFISVPLYLALLTFK